MTIDTVRTICCALPGTTEDIKWDHDLVFSVGGKMFAAVCLEPPHTVAFKCTPEQFAELVERDGIVPAPYLARAMWVQDRGVGDTLDRRELGDLLQRSYELVRAKLPKKRLADLAAAGSQPRRGRAAPARAGADLRQRQAKRANARSNAPGRRASPKPGRSPGSRKR